MTQNAEQSKPDEMYRLLLEHASDAIFSVSLPDCIIQSANPSLEEMTGYSAAFLLGKAIAPLCPEIAVERDGKSFGPHVLRMPGLHEDIRLACADGHVVYAALTVGHLDSGGRRLAICIVRDTTERRLLERELITKHTALRQAHQELTDTTQKLERRNLELMDLSSRMASVSKQAAIGAFTAGIAHSINNPLSVVVCGCREMAQAFAATPQNPERLALLLRRISDAAGRIQQVIVDLRRVQRGGAPRGERAIIELKSELERALELYSDRLANINVVRHYAPVPPIAAYPDELQYLFTNLIDNAIIALADKGTLTLSIAADGEHLRVSIDDDGPGFPASIRDQIFQPFVTTRVDGTGIGLSIASRLAQHHAGRLFLADKDTPGSQFILELPASGVQQDTPSLGRKEP